MLKTYLKIKEEKYIMNISFFYKGLFLILIGIGLSSQSNAAAPDHDDPAKSGDIIGQLSMCLGSNEGLRVYIAGTSFETITDSLGNFKISYAQVGTYSLTVRRDVNEIGIIPNVTVISKQTVNVGTVPFCLDNDNDGYTQDVDCNDNNPAINPGAVEICGDGIDNNCNDETDEGCPTCIDADGDGYFTGAGCTGNLDCDDTNALIFPGADEKCNGVDDNCDGTIDVDAVDKQTFYLDNDEDGYGDSSNTITSCQQPQGYVSVGGDCSDSNSSINPGAEEVCGDLIDNNCNYYIDEGCTCTNNGGATCETATMTGTICGDTGADAITITGCGDGTYKFVLNECLSTTIQNLSLSVSLQQPNNPSVSYAYTLHSPCDTNLGTGGEVNYEISDDPFTDNSQEFYINVHQLDGPVVSGDWQLSIHGNQ